VVVVLLRLRDELASASDESDAPDRPLDEVVDATSVVSDTEGSGSLEVTFAAITRVVDAGTRSSKTMIKTRTVD
jgi:hypothetical protein